MFYLDPGDELMSVAIGTGQTSAARPPTRLFDGCTGGARATFSYVYDVTADGNRSLWICPGNDSASAVVAR